MASGESSLMLVPSIWGLHVHQTQRHRALVSPEARQENVRLTHWQSAWPRQLPRLRPPGDHLTDHDYPVAASWVVAAAADEPWADAYQAGK